MIGKNSIVKISKKVKKFLNVMQKISPKNSVLLPRNRQKRKDFT